MILLELLRSLAKYYAEKCGDGYRYRLIAAKIRAGVPETKSLK